MAKDTTTTIDEELYDGLQQARKKKPRHFALVSKGADVVGLIVQKKKINDGQAAKAKTEAKGNAVIVGVCHGQGVELTFEVLDAEPNIKPLKIKDFIAEQTELTLKPQWAVVKAFTEVKEEDDVPPQPGGTGTQPPPPVTPPPGTQPPTSPPGDLLADLKARLKGLTPAVQNAILANPARKTELLGAVENCKKLIKAENATEAQPAVDELARLVNAPSSGGSSSAPTTGQPTTVQPTDGEDPAYAKAKAKFAACRGVWIKVRDQTVGNIHKIRDAMAAEYKDEAGMQENLARGVKALTDAAATFNDELKDKFDAYTADPPPPPEAREALKREALATIDKYRQEIETNVLYEAMDQREFAPVLIKAPLLKTLAALAKDLA